MLVEHDYVDGGLVVGLNAGFGAGKTAFIRMWEADLQARRDCGKFVPMPVVLNAWEGDSVRGSLCDVAHWSGSESHLQTVQFTAGISRGIR